MGRKSLFPKFSVEETLQIANTIWEKNAGNPMRRLTILDLLNRSPGSSSSRLLIIASSTYGLTIGSYSAEMIELTNRGLAITKEKSIEEKIDAVLSVEIFGLFFEKYKDAALPSEAAAEDFLREKGIPERSVNSCLQVILKNGRNVGLIQEIAGAGHIVSREHALETVREDKPEIEKEEGREIEKLTEKKKHIPSININIEIHLPSDAKPDIYSTIFKNIKEHLMGEE